MSHRRSPRPRRQTAPRGRGRRAKGVRDARRQPPCGHQRSAAPLGKVAIVRVAATGSAAVVDALFGAGGLGSGAPSVLSIERFAADALSTRALLVLISWARRPRTVSTASSSSLYASMCVGFESYRSSASVDAEGRRRRVVLSGSARRGLVVRSFVRCAAVGTGFVRQRPRRRRRAWLGSQLKAGRAVLKSVVSDAHWSRTCLVACHKLLGSPFGRLDRADRREPAKQKAAAASG